ncbi:MAG: Serine/threonine protein kinase [Labilithrix sp.]|nr:Serine/threonine protein kinase [Labilithrix sp.]
MIEASIGVGGMGEVYRAFDEKLRRKVALKVIHPDLAVPDAAARLVREARVAAGLAHPNTVAIFDLGEIDGTVFLVMELVSGAPLRAYVGDPAIPVARKIGWLVGIARGLAAAHKAGLVHRDVKPANVMVSDEDVVKVLDFGLAKPLEAASFHTDAGMVVGTPGYLAPELFMGDPADARSDQFAFGVTAYELLGGVHPGNALGPVPTALDARAPGVSPGVARVIARTLSRAVEDRFANMTEVANALEAELASARGGGTGGAPATRREGHVALAHAATQLAPSEAPPRLSRVSDQLQEPPRAGGRGTRVVAVLGLLAIGGAYAALRLLPGDAPVPAGPRDAATVEEARADAEGDALAAGDAGLAAAPDLDGAVDADAADADGGDADAEAERPGIQLDDFPDPWKKKPR